MKKIKAFWKKGKWQKTAIIFVLILIFGALLNLNNSAINKSYEDKPIEEALASVLDDVQTKEEDKTLNVYFKSPYQTSNGPTLNKYYENVRRASERIQNNKELDNYERINFVGNITEDGKIKCVMSGFFTVNQIKSCENFDKADIEGSLNDLHIPSVLQ